MKTTFNQWLKKITIKNIKITHETNRCVYKTPNKVNIYQDETYPHNIFKKPSFSTVVDLIIENNKENQNLIEKLGGYIDVNIYTTNGYGYPRFDKGNSEKQLKTAYNFAMELKNKFIKNKNKTIFAND